MIKEEIRLLFEKALSAEHGISDSEFDSLYPGAVNNHHYHDAIIIAFMCYLQCQSKGRPETLDAMGLLRESIELFLAKNKDLIENRDKAKREATKPVKYERYCSFCAKSETEAKTLIAGPSAFICEECVGLCAQILADKGIPNAAKPRRKKLPKPKKLAAKTPKRKK